MYKNFGLAVIDRDRNHYSHIISILNEYSKMHDIYFAPHYFNDPDELENDIRFYEFNIFIVDYSTVSDCSAFIHHIQNLNSRTQFIIAHTDKSLTYDILDCGASSYIAKPIMYRSLEKALDRTIPLIVYSVSLSSPDTARIPVKSNGRTVYLATSGIFYIEKSGNMAWIFTKSSKYSTHSSLKHLKSQLDPTHFIQIHQGCIVNWSHVTSIDNRKIRVGDISLNISNGYLALIHFHQKTHPLSLKG
ncbi:MAG: LytTR family transcriptional regulator DNA-binding domain-containing protein [Lachnospiraceae bacterium]|nr:LytTR family transcriptional regulator DNA-binding domain-containing protein [Lachnospiraceae bacterium]